MLQLTLTFSYGKPAAVLVDGLILYGEPHEYCVSSVVFPSVWNLSGSWHHDDEQLTADVIRIISGFPENSPARIVQSEGAGYFDVMRLVPEELIAPLKEADAAHRARIWGMS